MSKVTRHFLRYNITIAQYEVEYHKDDTMRYLDGARYRKLIVQCQSIPVSEEHG